MRIGPYQVLFELARGGMGTVYLARAMGPGGVERLVAIKRAHTHLLAQGVADRFLDEARIAAHVHHANVVGVHQAGSDGAGYYLVFDYVEGESLDGLVFRATQKGNRVPARIVLRVVLDALAGLHAAHETTHGAGKPLGILHRDVSVQNLLVGRDGVTRLADFGIAKSALSSVVTEQYYLQGKLVYLAPEYLQRRPVDRRLDVYAAGVTLWIALAGHPPWPAADEAQLLNSILLDGVPPLSSTGLEIAPEIEAIVSRACRHDASERFQTARELLEALEAAGASTGCVASHLEVAAYVEEVAGHDLSARRETIDEFRNRFVSTDDEDVSSAPAIARGASLHRPPASAVEFPSSTDNASRRWEGPSLLRRVLHGALFVGGVSSLVVAGFVLLRTPNSSRGDGAAPLATGTGASPRASAMGPSSLARPEASLVDASTGSSARIRAPSDLLSQPERPKTVTPAPSAAVPKARVPKQGPPPASAPASEGFEPFSRTNPYR